MLIQLGYELIPSKGDPRLFNVAHITLPKQSYPIILGEHICIGVLDAEIIRTLGISCSYVNNAQVVNCVNAHFKIALESSGNKYINTHSANSKVGALKSIPTSLSLSVSSVKFLQSTCEIEVEEIRKYYVSTG